MTVNTQRFTEPEQTEFQYCLLGQRHVIVPSQAVQIPEGYYQYNDEAVNMVLHFTTTVSEY